MSPILDATSLLPTGIVLDMVVDMIVGRCHEVRSFLFERLTAEILKPQEESHVIGTFTKLTTVPR